MQLNLKELLGLNFSVAWISLIFVCKLTEKQKFMVIIFSIHLSTECYYYNMTDHFLKVNLECYKMQFNSF